MAGVGRAELLAAWDEGGEASLAAMARLLDFEERPRAPEPSTITETVEPVEPVVVGKDPDSKLAPIPFWYLDEIEHLEPEIAPAAPPSAVRPIGLGGLGLRPGSPPAPPPLAPDARVLPALRRRLASEVPSREVDVDELVHRWSRGRSVRRLPFRPLSAWAPEIVVLVDRSARLIPFWDDQDRLLHRLRRRLGSAAIREVLFLEDYNFPWRSGRHRLLWPPAVPGAPVLALGDLGFLAGEKERAVWRSVGEHLGRAGACRCALVPCPADRWPPDAARFWDVVEWERPIGAPRFVRAPTEARRRDRAERLLGLLAFASRLEPALLRKVRRLLPATEADAGTEADAWSHPEVAGDFAPAALGADLRARLQARFAAESDDVKRRVVAVLRAFRDGLPQEIWLDEVLGLTAAGGLPDGTLGAAEVAAAREMWLRAAETVDGAAGSPAEVQRAVKAFVRRSLRERQPRAVWDDDELRPVLWRAWEAAWEGADAPFPEGVGPEILRVASNAVRRYQGRQVGGDLSFVAAGETSAPGSPLVDFEAANAEISVRAEGERFAIRHPIGSSASIPLLEAPSLNLRTDRTLASLRRLERPPWASAMGRDRFGLWASFEVEGVIQRLRYLPPGRFLMGSPEDEPGRRADEGPRHLENVRRGFWLGDTPCTQALWQAVTGENPSRFKTPGRPVEQVSWEDCERFLALLEERVPGLHVRLPTEVEWEYACRAGSETATYAGTMQILGMNNAPVLDGVAWYGGNSGQDFDLEEGYDSGGWEEKQYPHTKAGTRPVALKKPNPWGLYDMLGNVYEWCEDVWRPNYDAEPEGTGRVARGGSWCSLARGVRAAYRSFAHPSVRWYDQGFRLARGQSALRQGAEPRARSAAAAEQGAGRAGEAAAHGRRP